MDSGVDGDRGTELIEASITLEIKLSRSSYLPAVVLSVTSDTQLPVSVEFRPDAKLVGCATYRRLSDDSLGELRFTWLGCGESNSREKQIISVRVLDSLGNNIGKEAIPFELKDNGTYIALDAV